MINRAYINESAKTHIRVNGLGAAEIRILFYRNGRSVIIGNYATERSDDGLRKVFTINAAERI